MELRQYQKDLGKELYNSFSSYKKNLISLATGGGKSLIFSVISNYEIAANNPVLILVRRRHLVEQASLNLEKRNVPHGILMANHWRKDPKQLVQVASVDTFYARKMCPFADQESTLIIIDEAHDVRESGKKYMEVLNQYRNHRTVGFTGSPYPYSDYFQNVIEVILPFELRDLGYLVPEKTYIPAMIDVSSVKIQKGEFNQKQLTSACSTNQVIGDIIRCYRQYGENRSAILFAVSIEHAKIICDKLNAAGIPTGQINSSETKDSNTSVLSDFLSGKLKIIVNVGILTTGIDIPFVSLLIVARPTMSLNLHVQMLGRGLRPFPGKKDAIILDLAGNSLRHGSPYSIREPFSIKAKKKNQVRTWVCEECWRVNEGNGECSYCGHVKEKKKGRGIDYLDGDLVQLEVDEEKEQSNLFIREYEKLKLTKLRKRIFVPSWEMQELKKRFGTDKCRKYGNLIGFPKNLL